MTNLVYSLIIFNDRLEGFFIGLFESSEKARQVANTTYLLSQDSGITPVPMRSRKAGGWCNRPISENLYDLGLG